jgi:plastocyanin
MTWNWLRRAGASVAGVMFAVVMVGNPPPKTVVVLLEGNSFRPAAIHVRPGDSVRFVNGNGGPHNVKFVDDSVSAVAKQLLTKAMGGEKIGPMSSPLLLDPGETYAIAIPALSPGQYPLYCLPHVAQMRAKLIVDP